ncbi:MAG: DUF6506 family protein [Bacillota bacterium]
MALKAAFIFVAPAADANKHRSIVETQEVTLISVGVADYASAEAAAKALVDEGVVALELCGGFGVEGTARIKRAVGDKAAVGVVRFDIHPGIGNQSGDALFG